MVNIVTEKPPVEGVSIKYVCDWYVISKGTLLKLTDCHTRETSELKSLEKKS